MVTMTQPAKEQLDQYFAENPKSSIRIFLSSGSCAGPRLTLALDDAKPSDSVHDVDGYSFVVDKELLEQAQPINLDFVGHGFSLSSSLVLESGGCGGCSCSGGSCS